MDHQGRQAAERVTRKEGVVGDEHSIPWWKTPKGFLAVYALTGGFVTIIIRMFLPLLYSVGTVPDDRILDIMTTVLFTTCIGSAFMYFYGSSSGKSAQEMAQAELTKKLTDTPSQAAALAAAAVLAPIATSVAPPPAAERAVDEESKR